MTKFNTQKIDNMVTIRINEDSKQAKAVVEMLRTFSFVEVLESPRYNSATEKAIDEALEETSEISLVDFRKQLYS